MRGLAAQLADQLGAFALPGCAAASVDTQEASCGPSTWASATWERPVVGAMPAGHQQQRGFRSSGAQQLDLGWLGLRSLVVDDATHRGLVQQGGWWWGRTPYALTVLLDAPYMCAPLGLRTELCLSWCQTPIAAFREKKLSFGFSGGG